VKGTGSKEGQTIPPIGGKKKGNNRTDPGSEKRRPNKAKENERVTSNGGGDTNCSDKRNTGERAKRKKKKTPLVRGKQGAPGARYAKKLRKLKKITRLVKRTFRRPPSGPSLKDTLHQNHEQDRPSRERTGFQHVTKGKRGG